VVLDVDIPPSHPHDTKPDEGSIEMEKERQNGRGGITSPLVGEGGGWLAWIGTRGARGGERVLGATA